MKSHPSGHASVAHDYEAESDHHTLMRAAEITGDGKRMDGVHRHHAKQTEALTKVGTMLHGDRSLSKGRSLLKGRR